MLELVKMKTKTENKDFQKSLSGFENTLELYFDKKAPQLPEGIKEFIVKFGPYLTLISLVLAIPGILVALGLGALVAPFVALGSITGGFNLSLGLIISLITLVLTVMALPGLFKRQLKAWKLIFYSSLVSALGALLNFSLGSLIIGTAISWYFLFQIKSYYK